MLTKIKKRVYNIMYDYHYHMANYCYEQVDKYGPENNAKWEDRVMKHTVREMLLVDKLIELEET